jgi:hypothetical protein
LKFVYIQKKKYLHPLPLFFDDPIVLILLVDASVLGFVELFLQSFLNGLQLSNRLLQNIDIFFLSIQIALKNCKCLVLLGVLFLEALDPFVQLPDF